MSRKARSNGAEMRIEAVGNAGVAAVGRVEELREIVGPDRQEIDPRQQLVELEQERGHFDHDADLDALGQSVPVPPQMGELVFDHRLGLIEFIDHGDHREHEFERAPARGAQQRADLAAHQAGAVEAEPDRAPAERGVFLFQAAHIGQHLVAADIERAERDRLLAGGVEHGAVKRELFADARHRGRDHELQLGAEQSDARSAGILDMRKIDEQAGIDHQRNGLAVLGDAGLVAQRLILFLPPRAQPDAFGIGILDILRRADIDFPAAAVDDDRSPASTMPVAFSIWPTAAMPSARATIATCEVGPPSSSTRPRRRLRS